mmetsp:Transcript_19375/g.31750  ORF Transcript_19375/g.31750 Transcript_19375/m.31750 type:complete len:96 (+) Transcript_19375:484-771(+)
MISVQLVLCSLTLCDVVDFLRNLLCTGGSVHPYLVTLHETVHAASSKLHGCAFVSVAVGEKVAFVAPGAGRALRIHIAVNHDAVSFVLCRIKFGL